MNIKHFLRSRLLSNPFLRKRAISCLQWMRALRSVIADPLRRRRYATECSLVTLKAGKFPTWFGYYDKTPFSYDGSKLLAMAMESKIDWKKELVICPVTLGWFDINEALSGAPVFRPFSRSVTWSWQQGCMLQWYPKKAERLVSYNTLVDGRYGSIIQDIVTKEIIRSFEMPYYAINSQGTVGLALNFSRLERLRPGYGYSNFEDETLSQPCPDNDGIWTIDLETGKTHLLKTFFNIADFERPCFELNSSHYVNHLLFSPGGERFVFLHLWTHEGRRKNRLMLYDLTTNEMKVVEDASLVSHFCWISDGELVIFQTPREGPAGYYMYSLDGALRVEQSFRLEGLPMRDGHPGWNQDRKRLVIDTYPDKRGFQTLTVCDLETDTVNNIGRFFSPFRFRGAVRCDLHPRWDRSGNRICFDTTCGGTRAICVVMLS